MAEPRRTRITRNRRLWKLGTTQLIITLVIIVVINIVARRLHLGWGGSIVLCAVVAFGWPFVAAWWRERKR